MILALSPLASQGVLALVVGIPFLVVGFFWRRAQIHALDLHGPDDRDPAELFAFFVDPDDDFDLEVHDVA